MTPIGTSAGPPARRPRRRSLQVAAAVVVLGAVWVGADLAGPDDDVATTASSAPPPPTTLPATAAPPSTPPTPTALSTTVPPVTVPPVTVPPVTVPPTTLEPAVPTGRFTPASTPGGTTGVAPYIEYSVAAEDGTGIDPDELAAFVDETLADPRSWSGGGGASGFRRVAEGGLFTVVVATPDTVDRLCLPLQTAGIYSCGRNGYVAINLDRWLGATDEWPAALEEYRRYVVNHEVGHYLGRQHVPCPEPGVPAPVMMQQSKGLDGCLPNGWPYPA